MTILKGKADHLELGSWNLICQRCGVKRKNYDIEKEWTGLFVCRDKCLDFRHPQDFVRPTIDDTSVPFTSHPPTDGDASPTYDTTTGVQEHTIPSGTFDNSR